MLTLYGLVSMEATKFRLSSVAVRISRKPFGALRNSRKWRVEIRLGMKDVRIPSRPFGTPRDSGGYKSDVRLSKLVLQISSSLVELSQNLVKCLTFY